MNIKEETYWWTNPKIEVGKVEKAAIQAGKLDKMESCLIDACAATWR